MSHAGDVCCMCCAMLRCRSSAVFYPDVAGYWGMTCCHKKQGLRRATFASKARLYVLDCLHHKVKVVGFTFLSFTRDQTGCMVVI